MIRVAPSQINSYVCTDIQVLKRVQTCKHKVGGRLERDLEFLYDAESVHERVGGRKWRTDGDGRWQIERYAHRQREYAHCWQSHVRTNERQWSQILVTRSHIATPVQVIGAKCERRGRPERSGRTLEQEALGGALVALQPKTAQRRLLKLLLLTWDLIRASRQLLECGRVVLQLAALELECKRRANKRVDH